VKSKEAQNFLVVTFKWLLLNHTDNVVGIRQQGQPCRIKIISVANWNKTPVDWSTNWYASSGAFSAQYSTTPQERLPTLYQCDHPSSELASKRNKCYPNKKQQDVKNAVQLQSLIAQQHIPMQMSRREKYERTRSENSK
jgi:hypothetical protein